MSLTRLGPGGTVSGGALTGAHQQVSYAPPETEEDLPLQIVGMTRGVIEPAGATLQLPLPAGIEAGDYIVAVIFSTVDGVAITVNNGFSGLSFMVGNSGAMRADNLGTYIQAQTTTKTAVGGDTGPTINWPAANSRGGAYYVVVFRPSEGSSLAIHVSGAGDTNGLDDRVTSYPASASGRIQHFIQFSAWVGKGSNTLDPDTNSFSFDSDGSLDTSLPSDIIASANAIGVHSLIHGGWATSTPAPTVTIHWPTAIAQLQYVVGVDESGGSSNPIRDLLTLPVNSTLKGPWCELFASAEFTAKAMRLVFDSFGISASNNESWFVDIAVGPSGSEQIIVKDIEVRLRYVYNGSVIAYGNADVIIPVNIPAGSRVAARVLHKRVATLLNLNVYATLLD